MKLRGETHSGGFTRTTSLPRPDGGCWTLAIQPLPLGFHRRLRERGVIPPAPPIRIVRDSSGKPLRDEAGLAVSTPAADDPQFLAELELYHQRVAVLAVAHALQADPHVEFDAVEPQSAPGHRLPGAASEWTGYADALYAEMEQAGFTAGDLILLCDDVCRLSNLLGDHLRQAQRNFSSRPPTDTT